MVSKVYFFEGSVDNVNFNSYADDNNINILLREFGFKYNIENVDKMKDSYESFILYTNDETMLQYIDMVDGKYPIYFNRNKQWVSIHDIYPNLRKENNLTKMYWAGLFDEELPVELTSDWDEIEHK